MEKAQYNSYLLPNISYEGNFAAEQGRLLQAESVFNLLQAKLHKITPSFTDIKAEPIKNLTEGSKTTMQSLVDKMDNYKEILSSLKDLTAELTDMNKFNLLNFKYFASQVFIKKYQLLALNIKRLILNIKMRNSETMKSILAAAMIGRSSEVLLPIISPILAAFQALSTMLSGLLMGIETVLNMIPEFLKVDPEGMTFFMTPKSMQNVKLNPANTNKSITDRLPQSVKVAIATILKSIETANVAIKKANIALGAARGAASTAGSGKFSIGVLPELKELDCAKILEQVDKVLDFIPIPQALPKYEKLNITNLGFLAWLMTGWCPAGKQSFGFPYYP